MLPRRGADEGQGESRTSEAAGEGGMLGAVPRPSKAGQSRLPRVRLMWPEASGAVYDGRDRVKISMNFKQTQIARVRYRLTV